MKKNSFFKSNIKGKDLTLILILALVGLALSIYLTINYYSGGKVKFCITGSNCDAVKESMYSNVGGISVALIGLIGYIAIVAASLIPKIKKNKWTLLLIFSTIGVVFSIYLTYIEIFKIKAICSFCIFSFVLILLIFVNVLLKKDSMAPNSSLLITFIIGAIMSGIVVFSSHSIQSSSIDRELNESNSFQTGLAKHLGTIGATMYGSYKCPHCLDQKQLFGKAFKHVRYVECNSKGENANPSLCFVKGISIYPTWEIMGRYYQGQIPLEKLSEMSGYSQSSQDNLN